MLSRHFSRNPMPRINRRSRRRATVGGLDCRDWRVLLYGDDWFSPPAEASSSPALQTSANHPAVTKSRAAAWRRFRSELMGTCDPGQRPAAFYRELGLMAPPSRWLDQIGLLDARGLLNEDEARKVETLFPMLDANQAASFCSGFDGCDKFCAARTAEETGGGEAVHTSANGLVIEQERRAAQSLANAFQIAAEWHRRRGRETLAARYASRAMVWGGGR